MVRLGDTAETALVPLRGRRADFEDFVKMILTGRSDVTYRAYDIDAMLPKALIYAMAYSGFRTTPKGAIDSELRRMQSYIMMWGFGVLSVTQVALMIKRFYVWHRIKNHRKKPKGFRDPDESRKMAEENDRINKALRKGI